MAIYYGKIITIFENFLMFEILQTMSTIRQPDIRIRPDTKDLPSGTIQQWRTQGEGGKSPLEREKRKGKRGEKEGEKEKRKKKEEKGERKEKRRK